MFAAVTSGSLSTLELVIPSVASVDPRDSLGRTPLHFALQTDAPPQIIRLLTKRNFFQFFFSIFNYLFKKKKKKKFTKYKKNFKK
jgi:hypothetical protein